MEQKWKDPAGQGGVGCASDCRHSPDCNPFGDNIKHQLRLAHLQRRYRLGHARAALVASLLYDGGAR